MALIIRMRQQGRTNAHAFRIVVIDERQARDGKYVESLGWYNPHADTEELSYSIKPDRIQHWLDQGAQISDRVEALVARGAPEVLRHYHAKVQAHRISQTAKRRERRRRAAKTATK